MGAFNRYYFFVVFHQTRVGMIVKNKARDLMKNFNIRRNPNKSINRLKMYQDYVARGLAIPFHLANDASELEKYADATLSMEIGNQIVEPYEVMNESN